jgi:hypothetical protein
MIDSEIIKLLIKYNEYLNFEYAQFGLDEQDINEFIKYYNSTK